MSDEKSSFDVDQTGKVSSNRGLLLSRMITVSILFLLMWTIYFVVFHDVRLLRGSTPDDWYHVLTILPIWMAATIRYGLVVPFLCAIIFGVITSGEKFLRVFLFLLLLIVIFCAISTAFEFAFEHRRVALWKFDLIAFPFFCIFGGVMGRLLRKFIFKSN